ncbi:alpha/beta hydrolase-fold protein [Paenibacillus alvei]|uniref:Alpha/beta hydrolase-fold protein n=1 Tax=Paenibacillus alvei TaxID=44250 RepID=A0ABT4H201_PAEAL|nr:MULTISPECIES: alpha/beta hydrolase-fold protein [Paenibacillus]EJW19276.1 ferri-bacillibactin esterase BesA [Paenibacillus alvei DSM 29]MCY7483659.1 alpha/beta hydrolase [Paenibacillus alvei]MCY9543188.1 alpha/beta hydrolase-fold protein [Paenibacillus alvei]MCY9704854.1 alpha/beta hydrolase-fold protein [Paenibacillus alvei]MCY9735869.1 alpha/beta hydrolase-fold protein [Paenibacillus alvei]
MKIAEQPITLPRSTVYNMVSTHTNRDYRISVSVPEGEAPSEGYPVLYVLDGNALFPLCAESARVLKGRGIRGFGPLLVVGIGYLTEGDFPADRFYELTPPTDRASLPPRPGGEEWPPTGGGDNFLRYIEEELKPKIEEAYPIDRSKQALFGHSLGGLFTLNTMFTKPDLFQTYIAGSPSIWWSNRCVLEAEKTFTSIRAVESDPSPVRLLMTVGEEEASHPNRMLHNAEEMHQRLKKLEENGLSVDFHVFPGEGHLSVLPGLIGRAVRFALHK